MWSPPDPDPLLQRLRPLLDERAGQGDPWPLYDAAGARALERWAAAQLPPHRLMQRAGLAVARLALAVAPSARRHWIVAGPGNNGGDGFEAAWQLQRLGRPVRVLFLGDAAHLPPDAAASLTRAVASGVCIETAAPRAEDFGPEDLVIDALLGRGLGRRVEGPLAALIGTLNLAAAPVLAVDLPSGLPGDTGALAADAPCVIARWTLALLGLPAGLFTGEGRDHAGDIWWDDLAVQVPPVEAATPVAWLEGGRSVLQARPARRHAQHKGSFGDVWVVAGAEGMGGAAVLAARAALRAGAGRVYVAPLAPHQGLADPLHPELMLGALETLSDERLQAATVVAGCGGGAAMAAVLPRLLQHAGRLVLDADGLNAVAADASLRAILNRRSRTVLTPHPLEAARLLGTQAAAVQADRLQAARRLADETGTTVVLKGSGSIVTSPHALPSILPVGNAALATPGSGDVLAGWLGGLWSQWPESQEAAAQASRCAVWQHGWTAEQRRPDARPLPASLLADSLD